MLFLDLFSGFVRLCRRRRSVVDCYIWLWGLYRLLRDAIGRARLGTQRCIWRSVRDNDGCRLRFRRGFWFRQWLRRRLWLWRRFNNWLWFYNFWRLWW